MRILTMIIVAFVLATGSALAFEWEGELDPNDFDNWEVVSVQPAPRGLVWIYAKNPDQASPIDIIAMAVDPSDGTLLGYRYFKYGIPHAFTFNPILDKYVKKSLTEKDRKGCKKCHEPDKIPNGTAI